LNDCSVSDLVTGDGFKSRVFRQVAPNFAAAIQGQGGHRNKAKGAIMTVLEKSGAIDPLLHPKEAAKMLNVSVSWLAKARLRGDGPRYVKIGRAVRYLLSSLREFVKARMRGSTSEG
jgi:predicted DNA-binding transcriptional regulator AlpA